MSTTETKRRERTVDLINGPIFSSLIVFMLPLLGSNIFQQLYNTVDTLIVGNFLGDISLAAIGECTPVYELLVGFGVGIGNGLAIVTARSFGSGDTELLKKSVAASMIIGVGVSLALTVISQVSLYPLLRILNTPEEIIDEAYSYISTITMFILVMFAYNLCAALLRAVGNSFIPLLFLVFSSCANIALDIVFITRLNMGVRGAAIATVLAQGISVILCLIYIAKRGKILVPERKNFSVDPGLYREMLGQGFSMGFMSSIVSLGSVILQYGINGLGYLVIAAHTAARKLYMFSIMPITSMSLAFSTFVSQNKGADRGDRIIEATKVVYLYSVIATAVVTAVTWIFAPALVKLVSGSAEATVLDNAVLYLRVNSPFYAVLGWLGSTRYALQGLGEKILPLVSSVIELVGKILFVIIFIPLGGYLAVILCEPVIWCVMTTQLIISYVFNPYMREWNRKIKAER